MDYIRKHIVDTTLHTIETECNNIIKDIQEISKGDLKISFDIAHKQSQNTTIYKCDMGKIYSTIILATIQLATKAMYTPTAEYMSHTIDKVYRSISKGFITCAHGGTIHNMATFLLWYHMTKRKDNNTSVAVDPTTAISTSIDDIVDTCVRSMGFLDTAYKYDDDTDVVFNREYMDIDDICKIIKYTIYKVVHGDLNKLFKMDGDTIKIDVDNNIFDNMNKKDISIVDLNGVINSRYSFIYTAKATKIETLLSNIKLLKMDNNYTKKHTARFAAGKNDDFLNWKLLEEYLEYDVPSHKDVSEVFDILYVTHQLLYINKHKISKDKYMHAAYNGGSLIPINRSTLLLSINSLGFQNTLITYTYEESINALYSVALKCYNKCKNLY